MVDTDLTIVKSEPLPELTLADKPEAPEGAMSRFGGAALGALTSPLHFASALLTDPKGLYDSLVNQSAEHFEKAAQLWKDKQYGPAIHRAIAGVIPPYGVVPEAADKLREGDIAGGLGEAVGSGLTPKVMSLVPSVARGALHAPAAVASVARSAVSPATASRLVKHGSTALGATAGTALAGPAGGAMGAIVGSGIGEDLAARIKARLTPTPTRGPMKPNTLMTKDQLEIVLDEMKKSPAAHTLPGVAAGGEQAGADTMRMLNERPALLRRLTDQAPASSDVADVVPSRPPEGLSERRLTSAEQVRLDLQDPAIMRDAKAMQARASAAPRLKDTMPRGGEAVPVVPLSKAMAAVREAAPAAKLKLNAEETEASVKLVRAGHVPADVMTAIEAMRQLKGDLPSTPEMQADLSLRGPLGGRSENVSESPRSTKAKSPQQLLNEEAIARYRARQATSAGNPFR